jgi:hypothetical protein
LLRLSRLCGGRRRVLRLGGRLIGRLGRLGAHVERAAKLTDALPERTRKAGQALGTEHDQRDDRDEEKVNGALDAHAMEG